jgi:hypothetical protein
LRHHGISRATDERFDFQILFNPTEKDLDLPAFFVDIPNSLGNGIEVVGSKT